VPFLALLPRIARRAAVRTPLPGLAAGVAALALAGCVALDSDPMGLHMREKTRFESEWRRYVALPEAKALAVAGDPRGTYVSGIAHGEPSAEAAVARALVRCQERREDRRIEAPCRTYGIGNEVVEAGMNHE